MILLVQFQTIYIAHRGGIEPEGNRQIEKGGGPGYRVGGQHHTVAPSLTTQADTTISRFEIIKSKKRYPSTTVIATKAWKGKKVSGETGI